MRLKCIAKVEMRITNSIGRIITPTITLTGVIVSEIGKLSVFSTYGIEAAHQTKTSHGILGFETEFFIGCFFQYIIQQSSKLGSKL